jgi:hypothetical protein
MAGYLRFQSGEGEILVEVDELEVLSGTDEPNANVHKTGEQNAGLRQWVRDRAGGVVAVARSGFEEAVQQAIQLNVPAFLAAAEALEKPPAEIEILFGLKGTGEVGNLAVGKVAGECNYQVTMVWRHG